MWCLTLSVGHITFPSLESSRLFGPHDSLHWDPEICVLTSPAEDSDAHSGLRSTAVILQPLTPVMFPPVFGSTVLEGSVVCLLTSSIPFALSDNQHLLLENRIPNKFFCL